MCDDDWYKPHPDRKAPRARQPRLGENVWRLKDPVSQRVQSCELRDDSRAGAGWDVLLLEDGEPLFSRRCSTEREARFVAEAFKQDTMRGSWRPD
jgi:hypothetical protein